MRIARQKMKNLKISLSAPSDGFHADGRFFRIFFDLRLEKS